MIAVDRHIAALASAALLAGPALAADEDAVAKLEAWEGDRARLLSDVCMASAPDFSRVGDKAEAAGMQRGQGRWTFPPEVFVELRGNGEKCGCLTVMGAPDPAALMATLIERLHTDFPGAERPDDRPGDGYYAVYDREGTAVGLELNWEEFKGNVFIAGWVIAEGACPA